MGTSTKTENVDSSYRPRSEMLLEGRKRDIFVSEQGEYYCCFGSQPNNNDPSFTANEFLYPSADQGVQLARLERGTLFWDKFLNEHHKFKKLQELFVRFPAGPNNFYGVYKREEPILGGVDIEATREIFGATQEELENLTVIYRRLMGGPGTTRPRTTFSKNGPNPCDLSGSLIPKQFPYIAFEHSSDLWGHVSLSGFYRHLDFMLRDKRNCALWPRMIEEGIDEDFLNDLIDNIPIMPSSIIRFQS